MEKSTIIPNAFFKKVADWLVKEGIKGKTTLLPCPGGYGYLDGAGFPEPGLDGGLGRRHGKVGGIVLNVVGSVLTIKSNAWWLEATDSTKNRIWCNPRTKTGH